MKKFSFIPYLDLLVVLYYLLTYIFIMVFFIYVAVSDQLYKQIDTVEAELQYSIDSQDDAVTSLLSEKLNDLKEQENKYMLCKIKYLSISAFMIALILLDVKIYNRFKDKNCWYTSFHKNCSCLIESSLYNNPYRD